VSVRINCPGLIVFRKVEALPPRAKGPNAIAGLEGECRRLSGALRFAVEKAL
jgi:hypothetical protein